MHDPPQKETGSREMSDLLIAISVVARHLARKMEENDRNGEENHEQDE